MEPKQPLPDGSLDVLLKEYEHLKTEVQGRLKIAFSHVAFAGAIAAFAVPAAYNIGDYYFSWITSIVAVLAALGLGWIAFLNMRWVQHCGKYIERIEGRINAHFGDDVLGWERYASHVQARLWLLLPSKPAPDGSGATAPPPS